MGKKKILFYVKRKNGIIYQNIQAQTEIVYSILNEKDLSVKVDVTFDTFYKDKVKNRGNGNTPKN